MTAHNPIGSCCARPQLNDVGGIDDRARSDRAPAMAIAGILAALAVVYAGAMLLH